MEEEKHADLSDAIAIVVSFGELLQPERFAIIMQLNSFYSKSFVIVLLNDWSQ